MTARVAPAGLDVARALRDGWRAFHRAPGPFVAFTVLVTLLQALCHPLLSRRSDPLGGLTPADGLVVAAGALLWLAVSLWALCGYVRASWAALEGRRPGLSC